MSDALPLGRSAAAGAPWPPPHPVIDAPYGPRYEPPPLAPAPARPSSPPGWIQGPLEPAPHSKRSTVLVIVVCLVVYAVLGLLSDALVRFLERTLLRWQPGR